MQDLITLGKSCHRLIHIYFGIDVKKINKKILRIKRLLSFGVTKKMAFYIVSQSILYERIYQYLKYEYRN